MLQCGCLCAVLELLCRLGWDEWRSSLPLSKTSQTQFKMTLESIKYLVITSDRHGDVEAVDNVGDLVCAHLLLNAMVQQLLACLHSTETSA